MYGIQHHHVFILIVKVKLYVWHLHRSIIAMFHSFLLCALYQYKTPECGRISHCGKHTLVSSADGERGAPPMVAGHTLMGSLCTIHMYLCA